MNCNLRTQFLKIIRRAGLQPWPRLFHNLRASCETDLMAAHPIHVITEWLRNTPRVALKHYRQTLNADFEKAVRGSAELGARALQNPVQTGAARDGQETTRPPQPPTDVEGGRPLSTQVTRCHNILVGGTGFEPVTSSV